MSIKAMAIRLQEAWASTKVTRATSCSSNTNLTLKQDVIKLPEFNGQVGKDTISALDLISRIDKCQVSNDWNDITTFSNFRLVLWGEAKEWLASIICHLQLTPAQKITNSSLTALLN